MPNIFEQDIAEDFALSGTYEIFKAEADALFRNGYYRKAVESYTQALRRRRDDQIILVCRSRSYLMLGDTAKALQDADSSLAENKNYYLGMFQKAEALYNQGDFEMALVFYHRGNKLRPEYQNFRLGIQKAQESICNCVGTPDRVKLTTEGDLSFFNAHVEKKKKKKGVLCTQTPQTVQRVKRSSEKHGNEKTIKQMLGDLYGDRKFLEKILLETDTRTMTGRRVNSFADDGLTYLDKLAVFLQQVKPLYARKYEQRLALNRGRSAKISPHDYIQQEIKKIEAMLVEGNYEGSLRKSEKVMLLLDSYSEVQLSSKMTFVANLHSLIGNACLELNDFEKAEKHHLMDLQIGEERYAVVAELRALDNLGRVHAKSGNYRQAIEVWERKLPMSKEDSETAWLCLELGRCYLELGITSVAKDYGERSLTAAEDTHDDRWKLHAFVLISQAEVKSGRLSSALISFEKAFDLAVLLRDSEAKAAIRKAIDEVHVKIQQREVDTGLDLPQENLISETNGQEIEATNKMDSTEELQKTKEQHSNRGSAANLTKHMKSVAFSSSKSKHESDEHHDSVQE